MTVGQVAPTGVEIVEDESPSSVARFSPQGGADKVVVAGTPKLRAAMHLDTVMTFADRDVVTNYPAIVDHIHPFTLAPSDEAPGLEVIDHDGAKFVDVVATALGLDSLRAIDTGGDVYQSEPQQRESGNNAVALEPGVVITYDCNTLTNTLLRKARIEVITIVGAERRAPSADAAAAASTA